MLLCNNQSKSTQYPSWILKDPIRRQLQNCSLPFFQKFLRPESFSSAANTKDLSLLQSSTSARCLYKTICLLTLCFYSFTHSPSIFIFLFVPQEKFNHLMCKCCERLTCVRNTESFGKKAQIKVPLDETFNSIQKLLSHCRLLRRQTTS